MYKGEQRMKDLMYKVHFGWDDEAKVWVASSEDPEFTLEHESIVELAARVEKTILELQELNVKAVRPIGLLKGKYKIPSQEEFDAYNDEIEKMFYGLDESETGGE